jgi:DNA invertase Pin-like site-specific DNA recombinase
MDGFIEVVTYGRNSDNSQTTSQAIQDDAFGEFATSGFKTLFGRPARIVENYKDHGKSASKKRQLHKRHDFHRMLDDMRAGAIRRTGRVFPKIVLILNTSRFSRLHELDTLALYNVLREHNVQLVSVDDRKVYDFDGFAQIIDLLVKAKEDKEYARKIAVNTLRGNVRATRLGRCHQRFAPYGMAKLVITEEGEEKVIARKKSFNKPKDWLSYLIPGDPVEQEAVRAIYETFLKRDISYTEVARIFSTHPNRAFRLGPSGNGWQEQTVKHLLGNLHYAGFEFIGVETEGEHFRFSGGEVIDAKAFTKNDPLIVDVLTVGHARQGAVVDRDLFWAVQEKRKRKVARKSKPKSTETNPEGYTLTGILVCGNCGRLLYGHHNQGKGPIYNCKGAKQGLCGYWSVKEDVILPWLLSEIDRQVWSQLGDKPIIPDDSDDRAVVEEIARLDRKVTMLKGKINAVDDPDVIESLTEVLSATIKAKRELEGQAYRLSREERLMLAQERWEVFIEPMLVPVKTGRAGEGQESLLERLGIPQSEVDRLFNYTLIRPSAIRETLLSIGTEVKCGSKSGPRETGPPASGRRGTWTWAVLKQGSPPNG